MVLFNYATKELTAKVVYYGPGLCGKTTNLQWIHEKLPIKNKGKMLSLATETDRTLFFDFLPIELGSIRGMKTRIQLYTVPGQVFYNATRRMVLKGADCVVFVADSQEPVLEANMESLKNLRENLEANEINPAEIPMVLQFNKRDLPNALPLEILNERLNDGNYPFYEAVALKGIGVEETLKGATALVFRSLGAKYGDAGQQAAAAAPAKPVETTMPPVSRAPAPAPAPAPSRAAAGVAAATPPPAARAPMPAPRPAVPEELEPLEIEEMPESDPIPAISDVRATLVRGEADAAMLRRKLSVPLPPSPPPEAALELELEEQLEEQLVEVASPIEELTLEGDLEESIVESEPLEMPAPPAPAIARARPAAAVSAPAPLSARPRTQPTVTAPVSVEITAGDGPAQIAVPIEVQVGNGGAAISIHLRLTLNLKLK